MPPLPSRCFVCRLVASVALLAAPALAIAGPVSGTVRTTTKAGVASATAVVYAEPLDGPAPRRPGEISLGQRNKAFVPHVVAAPVGSTVRFPNHDTIFHNVFSLSAPEPFDLGLYRAGASRERTFANAGTFRVFCNIHPEMTALVVIVPTPYVIVVGADGRYTLDLPPGRYRLTAVSERAEPVSAEVVSAAGATTAPELVLNESEWVATQHKNKFGQDYPAAAYKKEGGSR
jgi:plastocyanin